LKIATEIELEMSASEEAVEAQREITLTRYAQSLCWKRDGIVDYFAKQQSPRVGPSDWNRIKTSRFLDLRQELVDFWTARNVDVEVLGEEIAEMEESGEMGYTAESVLAKHEKGVAKENKQIEKEMRAREKEEKAKEKEDKKGKRTKKGATAKTEKKEAEGQDKKVTLILFTQI
jgi:hypothetical protein